MTRTNWLALFSIGWTCVAATPSVYEKNLHVRVPMRDGVRLDTNVFRPPGSGRFPAILVRTPYGKGEDLLPNYQSFIDHGYVLIIQDVRGRYLSEGVFDPLDQEGPDGYDALTWIGHQAWSTGKVGMIGGSYGGIAQWKVALLNSPYLKAIFPVVAGSDDYTDRFYSTGGAMKFGHRLLWFSENLSAPGFRRPDFNSYVYQVPLRTADRAATGQSLAAYQKILNHPTYDAFWRSMSVREKIGQIRVPVFSVGGWYDNYVESDLAAFSSLAKNSSRRGSDRIVIGPWPHNMSMQFAGVSFGQDSSSPVRRYQIGWFDRWLKGSVDTTHSYSPGTWHEVRSEVDEAPVQIFVMGANRWRDEQEWPLARTRYTSMYLGGKGHANSAGGDGTLDWDETRKDKPDEYVYDPHKPVPTMGGAVCCNPKFFPWGPMDQRPVEKRNDVLVYTSRALKRDVEVTGPVRLELYVSTSVPDTDFTAKLVDVFPDGQARNLTDGILRLRYRQGLEKVVLAMPGQVYEVSIDVGVTSNVFLAGHRIRLEVSSSNFPRFDRNPNTGRPIADETQYRPAQQTIHHGRKYASRLILPVIPELTSSPTARYLSNKPLAQANKPSAKGMSFQAR